MPFALAIVSSVLIHLGVLFGPDWELPGLTGMDSPQTVDVVLIPVAKPRAPLPRLPVPKPASRKPAAKPALPSAAAQATTEDVSVPAAVSPAPTIEQAAAEIPVLPEVLAPVQETQPVVEPPPARIALPGKGRIQYQVIRGEQGFVIGQTIHEWEHDGSSYRARSVTETTGLAAIFKPARVVQSSQGQVTATGLRPSEFRHEKVKGVDAASFDWDRHVLAYEGKTVALPEGTQDMLSFYFQATLAALPGQVLDLSIATGRKLEHYRFEPRGEERLLVEGTEWQTWRYTAKSGADLIELWIAPEQRGLPIKIRFVDNKGEIFDQIAVAIDLKETQ